MKTLKRAIIEALNRRKDAGILKKTEIYRWVHGNSDQLEGLFVDRLGEVAVVRLRKSAWWENNSRVDELIDALLFAGASSIHLIVDEPKKHNQRKYAEIERVFNARLQAKNLYAPLVPFSVKENGFWFEVSINEGFSQGIFLDMREPKAALRERWKGRRILNLFSYTCAFGVYLAKKNEVVNVDISRKYLEWGKRNYVLNGFSIDQGFVKKDVFSYLEIGNKIGRKWDAIILDPPVFSRGKKGKSRRFSLKNDFDILIKNAFLALVPNGELFISTNFVGLSHEIFHAKLQALAEGKRLIKTWDPPADYPTSRRKYHLKTALFGK